MNRTTISSTAAVLTVAIAIAACAPGPTATPTAAVVAIRTQEPPPDDGLQACMGALMEGTLVASAGSGIGVRDPNGLTHAVIWPFGHSGRVDAAGLHLVDPAGVIVATVGDTVQVGGGEIGGAGTWVACTGISVVPH